MARILSCFWLIILFVFQSAMVSAAPAIPVQLAPQGVIATSQPEFIWQDQADTTLYRLHIYDRSIRARVHLQNYSSTDICSGGICSVTPDIDLGYSKQHRWSLKARNVEGYSGWSRLKFDFAETPPDVPIPLAPLTALSTPFPLIQWQGAATSTRYQLHVRDRAASVTVFYDMLVAENVCVSVDCEFSGVTVPESSALYFRIRAQNSGGWSPWSETADFSFQAASQGPVASDDSAAVTQGIAQLLFVLDNDSALTTPIDPSSVSVLDGASNGIAQPQPDGSILYTHDGGASLTDTFSYTVDDDQGVSSNVAFVTVTIEPVIANESPQAVDDAVSITVGAAQIIDVLDNDSDSDGTIDTGSVVITQIPTGGTAELVAGGKILYTHNGGASGTDTFAYTVKDNNNAISNEAFVTVTVVSGGGLTAFHRDGQTFLTWSESDSQDEYHVYRHNTPITETNLSAATRITSQWGPVGSDTSNNLHGGPNVPDNFVIDDLGPALSDDTGLFVYTTQPGDSQNAFYAITSVTNGVEATGSMLTTPAVVSESVATPSAVLTVSVNQGKGRIYTQYMDYSNWNPTFNGYAYNYSAALPYNYDPNKSYPLLVHPHAYYEVYTFAQQSQYQWEVIQMFPHDPGPPVGALHSWWYGYAADHNYLTDGPVPSSGTVENFTEQRVMRAIDELIVSADFNVDVKRVHSYGNSMGASGALSWGMRYSSVLAGIYANEPMTNYASSPTFSSEFERLWGTKADNLPIVNAGPHSQGIQIYGVGGVQAVGVWDWMNHHQQLVDRRGDTFAYLMTFHGKQDNIIDWQTQGKPIVQAFNNATAGFSARHGGNTGHTWSGFASVVRSMFGFGYDAEFPWKYPVDLSFPAIHNASGSSAVAPADTGDDSYNLNFEWATLHTPFDATIVDQADRYEITIRSTTSLQTADITPRRTQSFNVNTGQSCNWTATDRNTSQVLASGVMTADIDSLVTAVGVPLSTGTGTRLVIDCS